LRTGRLDRRVEKQVTISSGTVRGAVPAVVRRHVFLTAFVLLALLGGAIRLLPTSIAAAAGSSGQGTASTACSAK
jgi:hypothetical protein